MTPPETPDHPRSAHDQLLDVVIVGAGPAGLSAALILGRMRRTVLLVDTDAPAHAVSDGVHGFLGQDGTPPAQLRAIGREQLRPYPTVEVRPVAARRARVDNGGFELGLGDGTRVRTARMLLATGCAMSFRPRRRLGDVGEARVPLPVLPWLGGTRPACRRLRMQRAGGASGAPALVTDERCRLALRTRKHPHAGSARAPVARRRRHRRSAHRAHRRDRRGAKSRIHRGDGRAATRSSSNPGSSWPADWPSRWSRPDRDRHSRD